MGVPWANFHCVGKTSLRNEKLNNFARTGAIDLEVFFRMRGLMSSGPLDLFVFKISRMSFTRVDVILMLRNIGVSLLEKVGTEALEVSSKVCLAKKLLKAFALSRSSNSNWPSSIRGLLIFLQLESE